MTADIIFGIAIVGGFWWAIQTGARPNTGADARPRSSQPGKLR